MGLGGFGLRYQGADDLDDVLLLTAGKFRNLLECLADDANWSAVHFLRLNAEKVLDGDFENLCDGFDLFRPQGHVPTFPESVSGLSDAKFEGDLGLSKSRSLAGRVLAQAESGARTGGWSSCLHARIIVKAVGVSPCIRAERQKQASTLTCKIDPPGGR